MKEQRVANIAELTNQSYCVASSKYYTSNYDGFDLIVVGKEEVPAQKDVVKNSKSRYNRMKIDDMENSTIKFLMQKKDEYGFNYEDGERIVKTAKACAALSNEPLGLKHFKEALIYNAKRFKKDSAKQKTEKKSKVA